MDPQTKRNLKRLTDILHIRFPEVFGDKNSEGEQHDQQYWPRQSV